MKQLLLGVIFIFCFITEALSSEKILKLDKKTETFNYVSKPLRRSQIPIFDFLSKQVTKKGFEAVEVRERVPKLNIRKEPSVVTSQKYVVSFPTIKIIKFKEIKKLFQLQSPLSQFNFSSVKIQTPNRHKKRLGVFKDDSVLEMSAVQRLKPKLFKPKPVKLKTMTEQDKRERDFLTLAILYHEQQSCSEVMMLSHYLMSKGYNRPEVKYFLGSCQHKKKLYSESVPMLSSVIRTGIEYYTYQAVEELLENLPLGYEKVIADALAPPEVYRKLKKNQKDFYNYVLAKGRFIEGKLEDASKLAEIVSKKSKFYREAQFLLATSEFLRRNTAGGVKVLTRLSKKFSKSERMTDLYSLTHITLARFYFELGKYKKAIKFYEKVHLKHSLWFDSLIEKGWSQIRLNMYPHAIGNMYTVHSPGFKSVFKPETYIIRTIGYLNMCQFLEADQTLSFLEKRYPLWSKQINAYIGSSQSAYETVIKYLQSETSKLSVNGLPYQVLREIARDREYLNLQKMLNNTIDEIGYYNGAIKEILNIRGKIKKDIIAANAEIQRLEEKIKDYDVKKKFSKAKSKEEELSEVKDKFIYASYRLSLIDQGFVMYRKLTGDATKRVLKIRDTYITEANKVLRNALSLVKEKIAKVLKNNELLRYEIYANSGKNVRFRAAGGQIRGRTQASIDVKRSSQSSKNYGWDFKGEFWEDEIGRFISNIKNLCPKN